MKDSKPEKIHYFFEINTKLLTKEKKWMHFLQNFWRYLP